MKVFQDIFTNDEIMSDVFKFELAYDDVIMKVKSRLTSKDNCANVDIGYDPYSNIFICKNFKIGFFGIKNFTVAFAKLNLKSDRLSFLLFIVIEIKLLKLSKSLILTLKKLGLTILFTLIKNLI